MTQTKIASKENNFDLLRFIFSFIVVLGHFIAITKLDTFKKFSPYINTHISVTAFFCISGYLITRSYINTNSLKRYFIKRSARLLPAYIVVIFVCALLLSFTSEYSIHEYFLNTQLYKYLISNISFLNFLQPTLPGVFIKNNVENPVNGALWTLKIEVMFYLLLPAIIYFIQKSSKKHFFLLAIYLLSLLYQTTLDWYYKKTGNPIFQFLGHQLPGYLTYFVCGIALYYYLNYFIKHKNILFLIGLAIYLLERIYEVHILTPVALSLMVFGFAFSFKQFNGFAKYGDLSYGIYIYHFPIINLAIYFNLFDKNNSYITALAVIFVVLSISFISWHLIEKVALNKAHQMQG